MQRTVQLIIGQILTDEEFRAAFLERPIETLNSLRDRGLELTDVEVERANQDGSAAVGEWRGARRSAASALSPQQWRAVNDSRGIAHRDDPGHRRCTIASPVRRGLS